MTNDAGLPPQGCGGGPEATLRLLDADPDLGGSLSPGELRAAKPAILARRRLIPEGAWPGPSTEVPESGTAILLEGFLLRRYSLLGQTSAEILGPGDVIVPDPSPAETLPGVGVSWSVLRTCTLALLDTPAMLRAGRWPGVIAALVRRAGTRAARLVREDAIRRTPRVESRLLALLWELAGRWGRVTPAGIVLDVPLTHAALGQLAGARRPTVTTALTALQRDGRLSRRSDRLWVLTGSRETATPSPDEHRSPLISPRTEAGRRTGAAERDRVPRPGPIGGQEPIGAPATVTNH